MVRADEGPSEREGLAAGDRRLDPGAELREDPPAIEAELPDLAVRDPVADALHREEVDGVALARARGGAGAPAERREEVELAEPLLAVEAARRGVFRDERGQRAAEPTPAHVVTEHLRQDALRDGGRRAAAGELALDLAPLARHPGLVGREQDLALVGEVLVEGAGGVAGGARDPVRVRSVVADAVERRGRGGHETRARVGGRPAARSQARLRGRLRAHGGAT